MAKNSLKFLDGGGEMGEHIRTHDWAATPLGSPETWPQSLRTAVALLIRTSQPSYLFWGLHQIAFYNDATLPILGNKHPAGLGQPAHALWAEIWDTVGPLNESVLNGESLYFEDMLLVLGGRDIAQGWFSFSYTPLLDDNGEVAGIYCVATETTDRVIAVQELQKSKEAQERIALENHKSGESVRTAYALLQAVADGSEDAIASLDCEFRFTFMNDSYRHNFRTVFGVNAVLGDRLHELLAHRPDDQRQAVDLWGRALTGEKINIETEFGEEGQFRRKWRFRFYPIHDSEGRVIGAAHNATDVSDAKAHSERERLLGELEDQNRRKDEFLAMLAHELRNPLAPISAAASLLRLGTLDSKRVAMTSDVIGRQVAHMTNLIDDLLDVSRVTRGLVTLDFAEEPLESILNDAIEQATPLIRAKGHRISLLFAPEVVLVYGDKKRLVQALSNLLNNAAKYTSDGGHILLATIVTDTHVQIDVTDDGIGMDLAFTKRAFELFSQAERSSDRSAGGLGLGLALVKSLVELHHGTVSAFSAGMGKGSTFSMIMPRLS